MSSSSSTPPPRSNLPVVFFEPDSEAAATALSEALKKSVPPGAVVLGLLLKVECHEGQEKLVNWQFTHPDELKSLALALPEGAFTPSSNKE